MHTSLGQTRHADAKMCTRQLWVTDACTRTRFAVLSILTLVDFYLNTHWLNLPLYS